MKTGIVFEGGASRTIFFLWCHGCIYRKTYFPDYVIANSAGAANGVSYISKQKDAILKLLLTMEMINDI